MVAALLIAFFLGASGASGAILTQAILKNFDERAQQAIDDPARAEVVAAEVAAMRDELKHFNKTFTKSGKLLGNMYKDHSANSASMQAQLDVLNADWEAAQTSAIEHQFKIRERMTLEEWQAVVAND